MTTYTLADIDLTNALARVMAAYHPRLHDAGLKVGVLLARNPDGPAIKRNGYEEIATIKPVPLKDRLTKGYDAEVVIDGGDYERLRPGQQEALLDLLLSGLDTVDLTPDEMRAREDDDSVTWKTDDLGRPKLRTVQGDWNCGPGYAAVVARHGTDAIEYENIARCKARADAARRAGETGQEV